MADLAALAACGQQAEAPHALLHERAARITGAQLPAGFREKVPLNARVLRETS